MTDIEKTPARSVTVYFRDRAALVPEGIDDYGMRLVTR